MPYHDQQQFWKLDQTLNSARRFRLWREHHNRPFSQRNFTQATFITSLGILFFNVLSRLFSDDDALTQNNVLGYTSVLARLLPAMFVFFVFLSVLAYVAERGNLNELNQPHHRGAYDPTFISFMEKHGFPLGPRELSLFPHPYTTPGEKRHIASRLAKEPFLKDSILGRYLMNDVGIKSRTMQLSAR